MFQPGVMHADVEAALSSRGPGAAFRVIEPHRAQLTEHAWFARLWCALLEKVPNRSTLTEEACEAAERFGDDIEVVVAACAALNAAAALRPLDAPPRERGPEHAAAELAADALARSGGHPLDGYLHINRANALRAQGPDADAHALASYAAAIAQDDARGGWHFDLAVCHKWRGRWREAFESILRARARAGESRPIVWNLALAATALGEGDVAAGAWRDLGFEDVRLGAGGLPLLDSLPAARVRIRSRPSGHGLEAEPTERFEVLTVAPHSPGHGVVTTPSFGDSPVDYGDLVLWDGAPVADEDGTPVRPILERLRGGDESRLRFVAIVSPGDLEALTRHLPEGVRLFVRDEGFASGASEGERLVYGKLVAPAVLEPGDLRDRFEAASVALRNLRLAVPELYERAGDTRRAGQEHQAWKGVERAAIKRGLGRVQPLTPSA